MPNRVSEVCGSQGPGAPITNWLLPTAAVFLAQLHRPQPVPDPVPQKSAKTLLLSLLLQRWGELCVVAVQKEGQLCLAWVSSVRGCLFFLGSWKILRQFHKGKKIFLRAKEESQTHRTVEGLAQVHPASHCWSWTETQGPLVPGPYYTLFS